MVSKEGMLDEDAPARFVVLPPVVAAGGAGTPPPGRATASAGGARTGSRARARPSDLGRWQETFPRRPPPAPAPRPARGSRARDTSSRGGARQPAARRLVRRAHSPGRCGYLAGHSLCSLARRRTDLAPRSWLRGMRSGAAGTSPCATNQAQASATASSMALGVAELAPGFADVRPPLHRQQADGIGGEPIGCSGARRDRMNVVECAMPIMMAGDSRSLGSRHGRDSPGASP